MSEPQKSSKESKEPNDQADKDTWIRSVGLFGVIVTDLIVCSGLGVGAGYWAWKHWGAPFWVIILTSMIGLGLAFYRLYRASQLGDDNGKG